MTSLKRSKLKRDARANLREPQIDNKTDRTVVLPSATLLQIHRRCGYDAYRFERLQECRPNEIEHAMPAIQSK
jgi:hypothetical protein